MKGVDTPVVRWARALITELTTSNLVPRIGVQGAVTAAVPGKDKDAPEYNLADSVGCWALFAPPASPTTDAQGAISAACDALIVDLGDDASTVFATRDVRYAKFAADLKQGDSALINQYGSRLYLKEKQCGISAFGGSILFDVDTWTLGLVGIPKSAGGQAAWCSVDFKSFSAASASGGSSFSLSDATATVTGSTVNLNAANVVIGSGGSDPVVTLSYLAAVVTQFNAFAANVVAACAANTPTIVVAPVVIVPDGSKTVSATP